MLSKSCKAKHALFCNLILIYCRFRRKLRCKSARSTSTKSRSDSFLKNGHCRRSYGSNYSETQNAWIWGYRNWVIYWLSSKQKVILIVMLGELKMWWGWKISSLLSASSSNLHYVIYWQKACHTIISAIFIFQLVYWIIVHFHINKCTRF